MQKGASLQFRYGLGNGQGGERGIDSYWNLDYDIIRGAKGD